MTRIVDLKCRRNSNESSVEKEGEVERNTFVCSICRKNFTNKDDLGIHLKSHTTDDRKAFCNICCKNFSAKRNLIKHLRKVHKNYEEAEKIIVKKLKCPENNCQFKCRMMKGLRDHIDESHNIKILKDTLQFKNESEFQGWKKEEETNTTSLFISGRMKVTCADGSKKQILYCHRTGQYNPKGQGKYRMKSKGSCKIGVTCPATMEVTELPNGQLTVIYYKTHLGHSQDIVYLKLSREERAHLTKKIEQGFTFDSILEDVKDSSDFTSTKKKRIHLLSRKDLHNLTRDVNKNIGKNMKKRLEPEIETEGKAKNNNDIPMENLTFNYMKRQTLDVRNEFNSNSSNAVPVLQDARAEPETNHIQPPGEGVASQIVILSPEVNYTSVAEVILLSAGEQAHQQPINPASAEITHTSEQFLTLEEKSRINRPNLRLQVKDKLDKIIELLPKSEYLTPKQFDWVNSKLDGILSIFNEAEAKANIRQKTLSRKAGKKGKVGREEEIDKKEDKVSSQQVYVSPLVYAVYN